MDIVINGGGGVGQALASALSEEQHDVTVIELDPVRAEALQESLDCRVIAGSGTLPPVLRQARAGKSDIFVAVSDQDEVNLLSCIIAHRLGCPRTVCRVSQRAFNQPDAALPMEELGIGQVINPDAEASWEIVQLLRYPGTTEVLPLVGGAVAIAGMKITANSPLRDRSLAELGVQYPQLSYRMAVIRRGGDVLVPAGPDRLKEDDEVFVVAAPDVIEQIGRLAGAAQEQQLERVMILGANDLGRNVANLLQDTCRVVLVDQGGPELTQASEELERTLVIETKARDMELLEREGLAEMGALVAVTDDEETNLIACLYAKRLGTQRTIARVEQTSYRPLIVTLGVDAAVSARQSTVNAILKYLRAGTIQSIAQLRGVPAEAVDYLARPGARILDRPLRETHFPRGAIVGMVVRDQRVEIPTGDTTIREGDHVIVFALDSAARKVHKLFA